MLRNFVFLELLEPNIRNWHCMDDDPPFVAPCVQKMMHQHL
ncbi:hypothetical protein NPIL_617291, partial [Nephila pilipes]